MRVIAGEFRSRQLLSLPGTSTRPTPDRLRETLFSILMPLIEDCLFVDAYAGTGAVGIEAISRGARQAVFLEKDKDAVEIIRQNLATLKIKERGRLIKGSAHLHLGAMTEAIVFADPPYDKPHEYESLFAALAADPPQLAIVQHSVRYAAPETCGAMERTRVVKQGDNALSFYRVPLSHTASEEST
jgi:16S rRNA (guanine(966)-N(2))-methyltransferase RsmD